MDVLAASRCPRCRRIVAPPARLCPDHPVAMEPYQVSAVGEVVSFTTLHSPPEGFRSPLHIAIVELEGGARLFCHGEETRGVKIGSHVSVEDVNSVFYFSHMGFADRAPLLAARGVSRREGRGHRQELRQRIPERNARWTRLDADPRAPLASHPAPRARARPRARPLQACA
jgi:hypothetical protein